MIKYEKEYKSIREMLADHDVREQLQIAYCLSYSVLDMGGEIVEALNTNDETVKECVLFIWDHWGDMYVADMAQEGIIEFLPSALTARIADEIEREEREYKDYAGEEYTGYWMKLESKVVLHRGKNNVEKSIR